MILGETEQILEDPYDEFLFFGSKAKRKKRRAARKKRRAARKARRVARRTQRRAKRAERKANGTDFLSQVGQAYQQISSATPALSASYPPKGSSSGRPTDMDEIVPEMDSPIKVKKVDYKPYYILGGIGLVVLGVVGYGLIQNQKSNYISIRRDT